ncbi:DUF4376 domain-containing protein [Francisella philomiragia]|uniref:DUF4376 domain-containing protein n=1 Tax=Francisella philomiragia TaxID=28110 RepID=UPI001C9DC915|nr:DUF4376 domain-containing protein [Francisella philomiragia]MBY7733482.1 DUF4376 domain-containing protein [Francisella philomiragia]
MYYKDSLGNLYFKPSIKSINKKNLIEIDKEDFESITVDIHKPTKDALISTIRSIREKEISIAEIEYKDKKFKADRVTALEVNAYINAFQRAIPLGLRQPTDIVSRWRTQDNSYIDLYVEDMISISLLQTQVVATAFAKQEALELQLSTISDEELLDVNVQEFWDNIDESARSIS